MYAMQVCELKAYTDYDNIELTEEDIPPIHHIIKAAKLGHRESALILLKAAGGIMTKNQPLPDALSDYPDYFAACLAKVIEPSDDLNAAFNLKSTEKKAASSAIFHRNLRLSAQVQELALKEGISEKEACGRVSKIAFRGISTIENANVKHRKHAIQLLAIKKQMEDIFYETADANCKIVI